jgi:hypothetical protein
LAGFLVILGGIVIVNVSGALLAVLGGIPLIRHLELGLLFIGVPTLLGAPPTASLPPLFLSLPLSLSPPRLSSGSWA